MLLADVLSLQALLPGAAALLASAMAIHSLIQPTMTYGRRVLCGIYVFLSVLITGGLVFYGATQHENTREQTAYTNDINDKLDRLRALMGNNPNLTGPQVLQGIIERFAKPYQISDPQKSRLANEFFIMKAELPKTVTITAPPADDTARFVQVDLSNVFTRAGIEFLNKAQRP